MSGGGDTAAAYQHITKALVASPDDAGLKAQQIAFGDMLVSGLLPQAEARSPFDLTGRAEILERARGYVSSRHEEIERLLRDIASKKAELLEVMSAQASNPGLTAVFSALAPNAQYFRDDAALRAALHEGIRSRFALHSSQLRTNRDFGDLLKLRDHFIQFGLRELVTPELNAAIDQGVRNHLQTKVAGIVTDGHRGEAALWGILLGDQERKLNAAVALTGTTGRDGAFVNPLRARIHGLLGKAFDVAFIPDSSEWKNDSVLLVEIDLKDVGVRTGERPVTKSSQFIAGSREEENPAYTAALNTYNMAKDSDDRAMEQYLIKMEDYDERVQNMRMSSAPPIYIPPPDKPPFSAPPALERLQAIPQTINMGVQQTYEYVEKTTTADYFGELAIQLTLRADELISMDFTHADKGHAEWRENVGVNPEDQNVAPGDFSPGAVQMEATAFMGRLAESLATRIGAGLQGLSQKVMNSAVEQGSGQRFAMGVAIASIAAGPLKAEEAQPLITDPTPQPTTKWRSEAVMLALKRSNVPLDRNPRDLAAELLRPFNVTDAGLPAR
ncbi:MAG: hypothetical protein WD941_03055 [Opitutus sp.]